MPQPISLLEQSAQCYLDNAKSIPFWLALKPKTGLLYIFMDKKFKDLIYCYEAIWKLTPPEDSWEEISTQMIGENDHPWDYLGCSRCFRLKICWPITKRLIDRNWIFLINTFTERVTRQNLLIPSFVYALMERKHWSFYYIFKRITNEQSENTLTQVFTQILNSNLKDKFELLHELLNVEDKLQIHNKGLELDIMKACTERDVRLEDFKSVLSLGDCISDSTSHIIRIALSSFRQRNAEIFIYILNKHPEIIQIFFEIEQVEFLLSTASEIIEYLLDKNPNIIAVLDYWLSNEIKKYEYGNYNNTNILKRDLRNLYKVQVLISYFSNKTTIYELYDIWFDNVRRQFAKTKSKGYFLPCLVTIVKCLDKYGLSMEEPGNRFCYWIFKQKSSIDNIDFWHLDICCITERVLYTFLKYGYTFTGDLSIYFEEFSSGVLLKTLSIFYYASSNTIPLPVDFLKETLSIVQPRSLINLSAVAVRRLKCQSMKKFVNSLNLPSKINNQILLKEHLTLFDITRRINFGIFNENFSNDLETINNLLNERVFDDKHNHHDSFNGNVSSECDLYYSSDEEQTRQFESEDEN
ncbi:DgyrCDS8367 [Dimorphilus gyrociliatus]|uniref:DgyrCDS8367 n=1 Tax=Dimorphilus gyrociliatus TaxID=2664684 RepID=A0A7I8VW99_9ANNE|nr:DgyrCDS8367 [Dimorphilus gyrociliatus]